MASRDLRAVQVALGYSDIRENQRYAKVVALMEGKIKQQTADFIGLNHYESPLKTLALSEEIFICYVSGLGKKWRAQCTTIRTRDSHPGVSGGVG